MAWARTSELWLLSSDFHRIAACMRISFHYGTTEEKKPPGTSRFGSWNTLGFLMVRDMWGEVAAEADVHSDNEEGIYVNEDKECKLSSLMRR